MKKAPAKARAVAKKVTRPARKPAAKPTKPAATTVATLGPTPSAPQAPGGQASWEKKREEDLGDEEDEEP